MILSFLIFKGFRHEIQEKIFSFAAHVQLTKYDLNYSHEGLPVSRHRPIYDQHGIDEIAHVQVFAYKPALLRTDEEVTGILLKGVDRDVDSTRFVKNLVEGTFLQFPVKGNSKDLIISRYMAYKMEVELGDTVVVGFIQDPPRFRRLVIRGIYETGMEDFDESLALVDHRLIQRINGWADSLTGGYEIYLKDFDYLTEAANEIFSFMDYDMALEAIDSPGQYLHFFDWFRMLERNVYILLIIILVVAGINIVSIFFILIMERTNMVGMLKALGANHRQIRNVFIMHGVRLAIDGLLLGNLIGLGIAAIQYYARIIPLDAKTYYMDAVPIFWDWWIVAELNVFLLILLTLILAIPTLFIIPSITPIRAIRFD